MDKLRSAFSRPGLHLAYSADSYDSDTSYSSNTVTITSGLSLEQVSDDDESGKMSYDMKKPTCS